MNGPTVKIKQGRISADIYKYRNPKIQKRMRRTSYQARLGKRMDNITRKVLDNNIRLSSQPTDMIRIKVNRDERSQDLISRTITNAEIIPVVFPAMNEIPLRRLTREGVSDVLVPNLYQFTQEQYWDIYSPAEVRLDEDDLLLRLIYDPYSDEPNVVCLQVKESLATVGYNSIVYFKYRVTLYDENLPNAVVDVIKSANDKREELDW